MFLSTDTPTDSELQFAHIAPRNAADGEAVQQRLALIETLKRMGFYDPQALLERLADRAPLSSLPKRVPRTLHVS